MTDERQPVAWRFWVDDPESVFEPDWSAWSGDDSFRELMSRYAAKPLVTVKVQYAYMDPEAIIL